MKKTLIILLINFLIIGCTTNKKQISTPKKIEQIKKHNKPKYSREEISLELKNIVKDIIKLIVSKNISKINKNYIHSKYGFYDLYKYDGYESFVNDKMIYNLIEEDREELSHILLRVNKQSKDYVIIEQDIVFNCSPNDDEFYGWNGDGLYLSYLTNNNLSTMMKETNKYQKNKYSKNELEFVSVIENFSYKVILTPNIIFYLTKIEDRWYITLFDRISTNCSSPKEDFIK